MNSLSLSAQDQVYPRKLDIQVLVSSSVLIQNEHNHGVHALQLIRDLSAVQHNLQFWRYADRRSEEFKLSKGNNPMRAQRQQRLSASATQRVSGKHLKYALQQQLKYWRIQLEGSQRRLLIIADHNMDTTADALNPDIHKEYILNELLPQFQALGVQIYTIAVGSEADKAFLARLAEDSGGIAVSQPAKQAWTAQVISVFRHWQNYASLLVDDNVFAVDKHIRELTLFLPGKFKTDVVILQQPDGENISINTPLAGSSWLQQEDYTILQIERPQTGQWRFAKPMENYLLFIDSIVQVNNTDLPKHFFVNEELAFNSELREQNLIITNKKIQSSFTIELIAVDNQRAEQTILKEKQQSNDKGVYFNRLKLSQVSGASELVTVAESKQLQRALRQYVMVHPVPISAEKIYTPTHKLDAFRVDLTSERVMKDHVDIIAEIEYPDDIKDYKALSYDDEGDFWYIKAESLPLSANNQITFKIAGKTRSGRSFNSHINAVSLAPIDPNYAAEEQEMVVEALEKESVPMYLKALFVLFIISILFGLTLILLKLSRVHADRKARKILKGFEQ